MNTLSLWARRSPILFFVFTTLFLIAVDMLLGLAFDWGFSWKTIASNIGIGMFIQYGIWSWQKYEKENKVTTTLYKDRKKNSEMAVEN